ncbi:MAG: sugar ABC transporter permease [Chloroflexi bacterium]|nr:sugar ABC transporter permease [Chloroflexota bacterium]
MSHVNAQADSPGQSVRTPFRGRRQIQDRHIALFFIMPTLILLILINVFPLLYSLYLSFNDYSVIANEPPKWVALDNFEKILTTERSRYWHNFTVTGKYAVLSVGLQVVIGFTLAMLLRQKFKGSGLVTTLILIPMMLSPVVVGLFWKLIFDPSKGIFNYLIYMEPTASGREWLANPGLALWAIVIVDVWMWSPFVMLLCLSGLSAIPDYLYEAAAIDRASAWFQFRRITLPQVMPLLLIAVLFRTIEAFKAFDLVMGLTGGTPGDATETVAVRLYREAFLGKFKTGESSALAYIVLIIIIAVSNLYIRALNRMKEA